jgi:hypothetical protein
MAEPVELIFEFDFEVGLSLSDWEEIHGSLNRLSTLRPKVQKIIDTIESGHKVTVTVVPF